MFICAGCSVKVRLDRSQDRLSHCEPSGLSRFRVRELDRPTLARNSEYPIWQSRVTVPSAGLMQPLGHLTKQSVLRRGGVRAMRTVEPSSESRTRTPAYAVFEISIERLSHLLTFISRGGQHFVDEMKPTSPHRSRRSAQRSRGLADLKTKKRAVKKLIEGHTKRHRLSPTQDNVQKRWQKGYRTS